MSTNRIPERFRNAGASLEPEHTYIYGRVPFSGDRPYPDEDCSNVKKMACVWNRYTGEITAGGAMPSIQFWRGFSLNAARRECERQNANAVVRRRKE